MIVLSLLSCSLEIVKEKNAALSTTSTFEESSLIWCCYSPKQNTNRKEKVRITLEMLSILFCFTIFPTCTLSQHRNTSWLTLSSVSKKCIHVDLTVVSSFINHSHKNKYFSEYALPSGFFHL